MMDSINIERHYSRDSEQDYILQELEPSPVDDTPLADGQDSLSSYFPTSTNTNSITEGDNLDPRIKPIARTNTLGLSGNHGPAYYLTRIHQYSTYAFSVFAAFHIANTSIIPLFTQSVPASDTYLLLTRPYYQSLPFEPLLITAPLALHVSSGLALRLYRRRQQVARYGAESFSERRKLAWPPISGTSLLGYALVPLIVGHSFSSRIIPLWYEGGSSNVGLEFISHGFAKAPIPSWLAFPTLVGVGVAHFVWGWAKWLKLTPAHVSATGEQGKAIRRRRWWMVNAVSALVTGVWLAGGLGVVARAGAATGWLAKEYDELLAKIPIVGPFMK